MATQSFTGLNKTTIDNAVIGDIIAFANPYSLTSTGHTGIYAGTVAINGQRANKGTFGIIGTTDKAVSFQQGSSFTPSSIYSEPGIQHAD